MFVRAKRQVFVSDKPENHINEGQEKKKSKSKEKERREKKLQWFALYWLRFWPKTKVLDGRGLFDSNVFKNSVRYIRIKKSGSNSKTTGIVFCCKISHIWSFLK